MIESKLFNEWTAKASNKARVSLLLRALETRFNALPPDVVATIQACTDPEKFDRWIEQVILATSLDDFRRALDEG
jgi:hypothetical protein